MYPEPSTMRAKRLAPLGIIGTLGEILFGLATAEEVEKAHNQLKDLRFDQKQLIRIQKEQAHLVTELWLDYVMKQRTKGRSSVGLKGS